MPKHDPIVLTWEEWCAARAEKRTVLARFGLDVPSRRTVAIGSQEKRLRKAFAGRRIPTFAAIGQGG